MQRLCTFVSIFSIYHIFGAACGTQEVATGLESHRVAVEGGRSCKGELLHFEQSAGLLQCCRPVHDACLSGSPDSAILNPERFRLTSSRWPLIHTFSHPAVAIMSRPNRRAARLRRPKFLLVNSDWSSGESALHCLAEQSRFEDKVRAFSSSSLQRLMRGLWLQLSTAASARNPCSHDLPQRPSHRVQLERCS